MKRLGRSVLTVLACAVPHLPVAAAEAPAPAALQEELARPILGSEPARDAAGVVLAAGSGALELESGSLWPATRLAGRIVEWVFVGRGSVRLEPADEIEAGQLRLFTDASSLEEEFSAAVLVLASDAVEAELVAREPAPEDAAAALRARALQDEWRASAERRRMPVEASAVADALGDPTRADYFLGWLDSDDQGRFLVGHDRSEPEPVFAAKFHPLDATERERRAISRAIRRQQSQGRLVGRRFEDLGTLDVWTSSAPRDEAGAVVAGRPAFEPVRYAIDVEIDERRQWLGGEVAVEVRSIVAGARVLTLDLNPDMEIGGVRGPAGPLPFVRFGTTLLVDLGAGFEPGSSTTVTVDYGGKLLLHARSAWALADTQLWHPRAGAELRALYDVRITWPEKLELVAGGEAVAAGREGERRWETRRLAEPSLGFGFEVGRYRRETMRVGDVEVVLAFDPDGRDLGKEVQEEMRFAIRDSLAEFTRIFGPLPLRELSVATTPRAFSQSFPGFITLSTLMMTDFGAFQRYLGAEDRRTVIAHEIAHQWWGNRIGWGSYRDQWISESVASYAALAWSRTRLPEDDRPKVGPTWGWRSVLGDETEAGRSIESLGPLVLGPRLSSSHSESAYLAIVYKKGAIVLDMVANAIGQEKFVNALGSVAKDAAGRVISTEELFALLEEATGTKLDRLADRYVYSTGWPEIVYDYRFEQEEGRWLVVGSAAPLATAGRSFRLEKTETGALVVAARASRHDRAASELVVTPLQIGLWLPGEADEKARKSVARGEEPEPNKVLKGRIALQGDSTPFRIPVEARPVRFWLDRHGEAFATFRDARREPKFTAFRRGRELLDAGDLAAAEPALRDALAAPASEGGEEPGEVEERLASWLDLRIRLLLAEVALDRHDVAGARALLAEMKETSKSSMRDQFSSRILWLEGRIALESDPELAYKRFRKAGLDSAQGHLWLALAAHATGREKEYRAALEKAREKGADVSAAGTS